MELTPTVGRLRDCTGSDGEEMGMDMASAPCFLSQRRPLRLCGYDINYSCKVCGLMQILGQSHLKKNDKRSPVIYTV